VFTYYLSKNVLIKSFALGFLIIFNFFVFKNIRQNQNKQVREKNVVCYVPHPYKHNNDEIVIICDIYDGDMELGDLHGTIVFRRRLVMRYFLCYFK